MRSLGRTRSHGLRCAVIEPFEIDADLARARSLPPAWYTDRAALPREPEPPIPPG